MATYNNVETYLNEEVRRPIKTLLKDSDKLNRVMEVVDYLCNRYREMQCYANFCETKFDVKNVSFQDYMDYKLAHMKDVDYDKLDSPYTDEEIKVRTQML